VGAPGADARETTVVPIVAAKELADAVIALSLGSRTASSAGHGRY
jgi:hypothetical protein